MVVLPWTLNSRVNMIYIYNLLVYLVCIAGAADVSIEQTGCLSDTACNCNTNVNLTCTLTPFQFGMLWKVDSTTVFQCSSTACFVYNDNYTYYHDLSAGTFTISLIPITMAFDQIEFRCNGDGSDTATYHPNVVVRLENGDYSSEREDLGNIYRVNISTKRCVFPSDSFTFAWKASTSSVLEHDSMTLNDNTKTHVACPFDPNANCGSNGTINITDSIEIEKDVAGKLHYLFVKVTQNNHIETIQLPGQFWLKTITPENTSNWWKDNRYYFLICLLLLVFPGIVAYCYEELKRPEGQRWKCAICKTCKKSVINSEIEYAHASTSNRNKKDNDNGFLLTEQQHIARNSDQSNHSSRRNSNTLGTSLTTTNTNKDQKGATEDISKADNLSGSDTKHDRQNDIDNEEIRNQKGKKTKNKKDSKPSGKESKAVTLGCSGTKQDRQNDEYNEDNEEIRNQKGKKTKNKKDSKPSGKESKATTLDGSETKQDRQNDEYNEDNEDIQNQNKKKKKKKKKGNKTNEKESITPLAPIRGQTGQNTREHMQ